ncbi:uncharacterized protein LOC129808581 [Phlebotomus papatasi]|uniref:uncharacterized protein LOC129808581 n=1 Tax=Phlebotomus papatasi TaxID=29031 RepID=UPI0024846292|nr:uncharacterized protein LOC129808581 [Phlebotomus papatasi]
MSQFPRQNPYEYCSLSTTVLNKTLQRFWELENVPQEETITDDHVATENHFTTTYSRNPEGRFIVKLPFRKNPNLLGDSRPLAVRQLLALERRFEKNPKLRSLYTEVMNEQIRNQWIEPVPENSRSTSTYYMPHHGVLKDSTTTKLRIVFNASAKSSSGVSLNYLLRVGPTVQPTLTATLLRFRRHRFAMTADISKMYLQILMDPDDVNFQRFVWRSSKSQPIQDFRVSRLCFGVACSPFLATRALLQLANDHQTSHPLASEALLTYFYIDDCIYSCDSLDGALQTRAQLIEVLSSGGFKLARWSGNHKELATEGTNAATDTHFGEPDTKVLGLKWNCSSDSFRFVSPISSTEKCITKRQMASAIARLFDLIGLIGPIVVQARILLQVAHRECKTWDGALPGELVERWQDFTLNLQCVDQLSIPRWISSITNPSRVELHTFSDASQLAYGAAVYVVTYDSSDNICSRLLTAKSRIAPMDEITIPRLELCGALLASELAEKVRPIYNPDEMFFWCDAMVVLYWIHSPAESYKGFLCHRLQKIHSKTTPRQ